MWIPSNSELNDWPSRFTTAKSSAHFPPHHHQHITNQQKKKTRSILTSIHVIPSCWVDWGWFWDHSPFRRTCSHCEVQQHSSWRLELVFVDRREKVSLALAPFVRANRRAPAADLIALWIFFLLRRRVSFTVQGWTVRQSWWSLVIVMENPNIFFNRGLFLSLSRAQLARDIQQSSTTQLLDGHTGTLVF